MFSSFKKYIRQILGYYGISVWRAPSVSISTRELPAFACCAPDEVLRVDFDFVIRDFLMRQKSPEDISFFQVGAFDGVTGDPLHNYVKRYNWRGLLVEPQRYYFDMLRDAYKSQDNLMFFNGAVGRCDGEKVLYKVDKESVGSRYDSSKWDGGQIASFDRSHILNAGLNEDQICKEVVSVKHPMNLLEKRGMTDVDIIQIDVEGFDGEVVKMLNFCKINPSIIQFEHEHLDNKSHVDVVRVLVSNGYLVVPSGENTVAYKRE